MVLWMLGCSSDDIPCWSCMNIACPWAFYGHVLYRFNGLEIRLHFDTRRSSHPGLLFGVFLHHLQMLSFTLGTFERRYFQLNFIPSHPPSP